MGVGGGNEWGREKNEILIYMYVLYVCNTPLFVNPSVSLAYVTLHHIISSWSEGCGRRQISAPQHNA